MLNNTTPKAVWIIWRLASVGPNQSSNEPAATNWSTRDNASRPCSAAHNGHHHQDKTHRDTPRHLRRAVHQQKNPHHRTGTPPQSSGRLGPNTPQHGGSSHTGHLGLEATHAGPAQNIIGLIRVEGTFGNSEAPDAILGRSGQQGIFVELWNQSTGTTHSLQSRWRGRNGNQQTQQTNIHPTTKDINGALPAAPGASELELPLKPAPIKPAHGNWTKHHAPGTNTRPNNSSAANQHSPTSTSPGNRSAAKSPRLGSQQYRQQISIFIQSLPPSTRRSTSSGPNLRHQPAEQSTPAAGAHPRHLHHAMACPNTTTGHTGSQHLKATSPSKPRQPIQTRHKHSEQPQKKQCVASRPIPAGLTKVPMPAGSCFHSIAQARAETLAHIHKHAETYTDLCDGLMPDDSKAPSWAAYLDHMQKQTAWGGYLEITAAAWYCIVPEKASEETMCFHNSRRATADIILWYDGTHYDYIRPQDNIPEDIITQRGKPKQGFEVEHTPHDGPGHTHCSHSSSHSHNLHQRSIAATPQQQQILTNSTTSPATCPHTIKPQAATTTAQSTGHQQLLRRQPRPLWHCPLCPYHTEVPTHNTTAAQRRNGQHSAANASTTSRATTYPSMPQSRRPPAQLLEDRPITLPADTPLQPLPQQASPSSSSAPLLPKGSAPEHARDQHGLALRQHGASSADPHPSTAVLLSCTRAQRGPTPHRPQLPPTVVIAEQPLHATPGDR